MAETIFTKLIRGEIPCHKVYEDDRVFSFLDNGPLSRGHLLVIPKEPAASLHELSEASSEAIGRILPRLCRALLAATGATAYNVLQNNGRLAHQAVMHVHFHVIPKYSDDDGLGIEWNPQAFDQVAAAQLAKTIANELSV